MMENPDENADGRPREKADETAAPPNARGRYQAEPGQATGKVGAPTQPPVKPLVDITQEETREMPRQGVHFGLRHIVAMIVAIALMVAFFWFLEQ